MADAFAPQLTSEVRFNQPVETQAAPSAFSGLADLAGGFVKAFAGAREDAKEANKPPSPSYAQSREEFFLPKYREEVDKLQQARESGAISEDQFRIRIGRLNTHFADQGVGVDTGAFTNTLTSITGLPAEIAVMSDSQILYNNLVKTPEGQGKLALAQMTLVEQGQDLTIDNLIAVVNTEQAKQQERDNLKINDDLSYRKAEPVLRTAVQDMAAKYEMSLRVMEQAGIPTNDPESLQATYLGYLNERNSIVSQLPTTLEGRDEKIKALFGTTDAFFERLGVTKGGEFTRMSKSELDMVRETQLALEMVNADPVLSQNLIDSGYADPNFTITPQLHAYLKTVLTQSGKDINTLVPVTPAWVADANIILTNDMITVAQQLQTVGAKSIFDAQTYVDAAKAALGPEVAAQWDSNSPEKNLKNLMHNMKMVGGWDAKAIANGQANTEYVANNLIMAGAALNAIDFSEDAVSFNGLQQAASVNIPETIAALEQADPAKGKAVRAVWAYALGGSAAQYKIAIESSESSLGIVYNPETRSYNIDLNKIGPDDAEMAWAAGVVNKRYGGDIARAIKDGFKAVKPEDAFGGLSGRAEAAQAGSIASLAAQLTSLVGADEDEINRVMDMRKSYLYADSLYRQIEPEELRVLRESGQNAFNATQGDVVAAQTLETLANTPRPGEITQSTLPQSSYRLPEEVAQDQEFITKANELASEMGFDVNDLFRVIEFETAGSWSPSIRNPNGSATGLIQFIESTAKGLGTTTKDLAGMSRGEQMEFVKNYFAPYKGRLKNFGDIYMAVHYPAAVGKSETFVMYSQGSAEYAANKNLDTNGDGTVTRGETIASVISRTGGGRGVMTTPVTAQTEAFRAEAAQDISSVAPPGGFSPSASPAPGPAVTTTEIAPAQTVVATAELPVDFSNAAAGVMPQEDQAQAQAPVVDAEVQALINNLSPKTKRQLRLAGIEPNEVKFYQTEDEAQAAIEAGELVEGMAFVLPDGSVRLVEGE